MTFYINRKLFQVQSLGEDAATVVYQNQRLPLHTDFSFANNVPGVMINNIKVICNRLAINI